MSSLLPGTNLNEGWLHSMEELHRQLGSPADPKPNYRRYQMLQTLQVYEGHYLRGTISAPDIDKFREHLKPFRRRLYDSLFAFLAKAASVAPSWAEPYVRGTVGAYTRQFPGWDPMHDTHRYRNIVEIAELLSCEEHLTRWEAQRGPWLRRQILRYLLPR